MPTEMEMNIRLQIVLQIMRSDPNKGTDQIKREATTLVNYITK